MKIEILSLRLIDTKHSLRAFVDVRIGDWVIHDFRIIKQNGQRAFVNPPQASWKDPQTGQIKFKGILTIPPEQKQRIDTEILYAYQREMEKRDEEDSK